jgi:hypothetical protein
MTFGLVFFTVCVCVQVKLSMLGIYNEVARDLFLQCVGVQVKFSMLEIYNEVARDLLDSTSGKKKIGLKIRQHPKRGFYGKE